MTPVPSWDNNAPMGSRLSVVHVYKGYPPARGGIEGHIDLLARLLAERGVRTEVMCARPRGALRFEIRNGTQVRRCASLPTMASTPVPPALPWHLRRSSASIVHLHHPWPPGDLAWLLGGRGRPLVVTVHCAVVRYVRLARLLSPLSQAVLRRARRILVTGPFMRDAGFLAAHRERIELVPLGVDLHVFRPDFSRNDPLPRVSRPRILFAGRLRRYKGLPVLAAALGRLPDAFLVVVGAGPARREFEAALDASGCRGRVFFAGEVETERLVELLQTSDVAVLPSTSNAEAFGLALAEAQACGIPAVATDVGTGTRQVVDDGVSGRVVAPNDPVALAEALAWCVDPQRTAALRAAARAHAEANLCGRRMAAAVHAIYQQIAP